MRRLLLFLCLAASLIAADKPNIVYILTDDLGYGDISCQGQKHFKTPHIDKLAETGIRFTQHYSGSTVCAPSRCSLMTGFHTGRCFVRGNKEYRPVGQEPLPENAVTVAELLKSAGYATGAFGKWGLGYPGSVGDPIKQGFDRFYGYNCQRNAHTFYPTRLYDNDKEVKLDGKTYSHDLIMTQGLDFIRSNKDKPFFCFLPVTIPHAAMHVPEEYVAPFRKQFAEYEDTIGRYSGPQVKNPVAAFAGMMTKLDEDVGRLVALLAELGLSEKTLVIFTSDNGPHKEGGHKPEVFDSNGPLQGLKRSLTEGGIRVPMLASWPGTIAAGSTSDHLSAFWDALPTFCELGGIDAPAGIDGLSFAPTLLGKAQDAHPYLYWEFHERGGKRAARVGKWKAIQRDLKKKTPGPVMLFNLEKDLGETKDVASANPEVLARFMRIFEEAHRPSDIWKFPFDK
jgi:arylsulfatase A